MPRMVCDMIEAHVYRITRDGPEFLVLRRAPQERLPGTWHGIYGVIQPGETSPQAAVREIQEETGLEPLALYQLDTVNTFYVAAEDLIYNNPVFVAQVAHTAVVRLDAEHDAFEWLPPDQAMARYLWPGQRRAIAEIMTDIVTPGPATPYLRIPL